MNRPVLADRYHCTGCLACIDVCPVGALSKRYDEDCCLTYQVNDDACIHCGLCEKTCPSVSGYRYGDDKIKDSQLFVGWTFDAILRKKSSSGGIFAALAKVVIENGGAAVGASLSGYTINHIVIDKVEDICKLQGSKYAQSVTLGIYKQTRELLKQGRTVLFSGLGCQVAGLLSFLGDKFDKSNLLTVDLVCGGVPSSFLVQQFERECKEEYPAIHYFRRKQTYEFAVEDKTGQSHVIPLSEKPLPLCGFYTELANRYSCYDCQFAYVHRKADMTIADFWGDDKYPGQHQQGVSAIVVHSTKGLEWVKRAEVEFHDAEWSTFLTHNHRMVDGYNGNGKSEARKNLVNAIANYDRFSFLCTYANYATIKRPMTWVKKIWRYAKGRMQKNTHIEKINKVLSQL